MEDIISNCRIMSSMKRRQIDKSYSAKQTQIPFAQTKHSESELTMANKITYSKKNEPSLTTPQFNYGAKSPYRSFKRIEILMKDSPSFSQCGNAKNLETPASDFLNKLQRNFSQSSKPSSVTSACTYAPNDFSSSKNDYSQLMSQKSKQDLFSDKKQNSSSKKLVGSKRQAEKSLEHMEFFTRVRSKAAQHVLKCIKLKNKQTGQVVEFSMINEENVEALRSALVSQFDTSKLEVEYDYDTDFEQMTQSKKMLIEELRQAVDFFMKEDPLKLVDNILL